LSFALASSPGRTDSLASRGGFTVSATSGGELPEILYQSE
jgi:hypothetical protein